MVVAGYDQTVAGSHEATVRADRRTHQASRSRRRHQRSGSVTVTASDLLLHRCRFGLAVARARSTQLLYAD